MIPLSNDNNNNNNGNSISNYNSTTIVDMNPPPLMEKRDSFTVIPITPLLQDKQKDIDTNSNNKNRNHTWGETAPLLNHYVA